MARADACLPLGLEAAGDKLSAKEVGEIIEQLRKRQRDLRASETVVNDQDAALRAAEDFASEQELAAVIVKRNEAINLAARKNLLGYVKGQWGDRMVDGLEARLVGVQRARVGARQSIAAEQRAMRQQYVGGLISDLERAGVREAFASGALDLEVSRALFSIDDGAAVRGMNPDAVKIAKVVHEWQERARIDANKAGAWIKKLPGYVARQSHDAHKIEKAGFTAWRDAILPKLDVARSFPDTAPGELDSGLRDVWRGLSTGIHLTAETGKVSGFTGGGNVAKKLSHERVLHFRDADNWFEYNREFGSGNLREAVAFGLSKAADSTALMRGLGTNPRQNLEAVIGQLQKGADEKQLKALNDGKKALLDAMLGHLDGTATRPNSQQWARFWANARALQSMAKLGGAVVSAVTDLPLYASEMRYQGRGMLSGLAEAIGGLTKGKRDAESREILSSLGVFFESMSGDLVSRFSADDSLSGGMNRAMRQFFKLNALSWWTDTMRGTAGLATSHHLAQQAAKDWGGIPADVRRTLSLYGIDAQRWDLMRASEIREHDGRAFLTPEGFDAIPDAKLKAYLDGRGLPTTGRAVDNLREELASQLRQYVSDRVDYAVINPDAKSRAFMLGGDQPGTFAGELRRLIFQFKAFPISVVQRTLGREVLGRGSDSVGRALRNGNGEMLGLVNVLFWTTMFGYGAMAAKDTLKGRTPRDPTDPKTIMAAMLQGGALGIYGDFLLGESNRFGRSMLETAAGPVLGTISDVDQIRAAAMAGEDVASKSIRAVTSNTPFLNLFYTRMAVDYLLLYRIQEHLNPGSLRRMERNVEKQNNQTFIVPPSEVVN